MKTECDQVHKIVYIIYNKINERLTNCFASHATQQQQQHQPILSNLKYVSILALCVCSNFRDK